MKTLQLRKSIVIISEPLYNVRRIWDTTQNESWMSKRELRRYIKSLKLNGEVKSNT